MRVRIWQVSPPSAAWWMPLRATWFWGLSVLACGVRFHSSTHQPLRDYERGYVKEGVGAGGLLLLAQLRGCSCADLVLDCEHALEQLLSRPVTSSP